MPLTTKTEEASNLLEPNFNSKAKESDAPGIIRAPSVGSLELKTERPGLNMIMNMQRAQQIAANRRHILTASMGYVPTLTSRTV